MTVEDDVDLCHIGVADFSADGVQVLDNLGRRAEADQRRTAERERDEKETARQEALANLGTARRAIEQKRSCGIEPKLD